MPDLNDKENAPLDPRIAKRIADISDILSNNPERAASMDRDAWTMAEGSDDLQREADEILGAIRPPEGEQPEEESPEQPEEESPEQPEEESPEQDEELAAAYGMDVKTNGRFDPDKQAKKIYAVYQRSKSPILKTARIIRGMRGDAVNTGIKSYVMTKDGFKLSDYPEEIDGLRIISARTGAGKTLTAVSEAAYLATYGNDPRPNEITESGDPIKQKELYIVFLSLEESLDRITGRLLASYAYFKGEQERREKSSTSFVPLVPTSEEIERYIAKRYIPDRKDGVKGWVVKQKIEEIGAEMDKHFEIYSDDFFTHQAHLYKSRPVVILNYIHNLQIGIQAIHDKHKDKEVLFYIDYTQLLKAESKLSRFDQLQTIMREFKDMSQHGVRIIAAAQSNRELAKKSPTTYEEVYNAQNEGLRESGDIEQTASSVYYVVKDDQNDELIRINLKYRGRGNRGSVARYPIDKATSTVDFTRPRMPRETRDGNPVFDNGDSGSGARRTTTPEREFDAQGRPIPKKRR